MVKLGNVKLFYIDEGKRKSASGDAEDKGSFVWINLKPSKKREKFDTLLIPWNNVVKVIVLNE